MDRVKVPASITLERGFSTQRHKWKSNPKKESVYKRLSKRAFIRLTCKNFAYKVSQLKKESRQILIEFIDKSNVVIHRTNGRGISMQGYAGAHPCIQIIANKCLPLELRNKLENNKEKSKTYPITVELKIDEWGDIALLPSDFIIDIENEAKRLMNYAIQNGFSVSRISKGREYDLSLIKPDKKELIIAISSHVAKNPSRSKEKTIQKILMDISKMLPYLDKNKKAVPIIITRPIKFKDSWSHTTKDYLEFYKKRFGFKFMTTEFKNGWEEDIIKELLKI